MKKLLALLLSVIMVLTVLPMGAIATSAQTNSVPDGYTAIRTVLDLYKVRYDLTANYILMNDIDLTSVTAVGGDYDYCGNGWNPIGSDDVYGNTGEFTGIFDGNGYTISGMRMAVSTLPSGTGSYLYLGLFANNKGTIKNLHIQGDISTSAYSYFRYVYSGSIAAINSGTIINCSSSAQVNITLGSNDYNAFVGGIAGKNTGSIENCYNTGNVLAKVYEAYSYAGGISGYGENGNVINCYNAGTIEAKQTYSTNSYYCYAGGIQGYSTYDNSQTSYIKNCYNIGAVTATHAYSSSYAKKNAITYNAYTSYVKVQNCYYLIGKGSGCTGSTELTEEQALIESSYNGFDFNDVWVHNSNAIYEYPQLVSNIQDDRDLISAEIYTMPQKTIFTKWDEFEVEGCKLKFTFSNAATEYITVTKDMVSGYDMNSLGEQTLQIKANRRVITYTITVLEKEFIPIRTALDLYKVRYDLTANYILMNDIDLTSVTAVGGDYDYCGNGWNPIGSDDVYGNTGEFTGIFDGNGYTISGMRMAVSTLPSGTGSSLYLGLFANNKGTIKNLHIQGDISRSAYSYYKYVYSGSIAAINSGTIINCSSSAQVNITLGSNDYNAFVGGIAGKNTGSIENCYNTGNVLAKVYKAYSYAGGISGYGENGNVINCYNAGTIEAKQTYSTNSYYCYAGGIQGYSTYDNSQTSYIKNCYNIGAVTATHAYSSSYAKKNAITYNAYTSYVKVQNCYYLTGTGDSCTGATQLSAALLKEASVLSGFDFENIWTMAGSSSYDYPELQCFPISGEIGIKGDVAYLSTVEPNVGDIYSADETYSCEWSVNGVVVATTQTYTLKVSDVGKKLKLKVIGTDDYNKGVLYSDEITVSKAIQTGEAVVPTQILLDDNKLEITTVSTQEYSLDNEIWQKSGVFTNLEPNKQYTVYSRIAENDLYLAGESEDVLTVTTNRRPLTGTVSITGTGRYNSILTANVSSVGPQNATYTYKWMCDDTIIGTQSTYTVGANDIGKDVTLYVSGSGDYTGTLISTAIMCTKANNSKASAPVVVSVTKNSVTLSTKSGYEYSKDGVNWQSSPTFTGLSVATTYNFYQRIKETNTHYVGACSEKTTATTLKNTGTVANAPTLNTRTGDSIILNAVSGCEYSKDGVTWQSSNVFSNLRPCTEYTFYQRYKETATTYAGASSPAKVISTLKTHEFDNACDKYCNICGDERSVPAHVYDNACDRYCNVCNASRSVPAHVYSNACDTSCNVCGATRTVSAHAYTNACDASCNVCGYTRTPEPHKVSFYTFANSTNYPFTLSNGIYTSTNKSDSTSATATLTATASGTITIKYYTSTESGYDKLIIKLNSTEKVVASGTTSWTTINIPVVAGDKIYITYSKDRSQSSGSDLVKFKLSPVPGGLAEDMEPTCEDAVICSVCGETVKSALGHTYTNACDTTCNRCGKSRTVSGHVYTNACDASCNICGATRVASSHVYTNVCDANCNVCGAIRTPPHNYQWVIDKANNCGEAGKKHEECSVCKHVRNSNTVISATGNHNYTNACDASCNVCGYTRTPESHKVNLYTFANATNYPFSLSSGIYTSTNKANSSLATATLTATASGTITIKYYTSTEKNYDKLIIKLNSTQKVSASGTTSWTTINIPVVAGDKIYITYSKDSSQFSGSDLVKFELSPVPGGLAEDMEPTCEDAVICSVCGETVKSALGHTYTNACDTTCNVCGTTRTIAHIYDNTCDTSCNECAATRTITHTYDNTCDTSCNVCGATRTITHTYDNACDTSCNVCGATRTITHNYQWVVDSENNCGVNGTKHEECTVCGDKRNENTIISATGKHVYDNACDTTCNVCNAKRKVGAHKYDNACDTNCNICNAKRSITYNYKLYTTAATLSRDGKVVKKCSVCGRISSQRVVKRVKSVALTTTAYAYNGTIRTPGVKVTDSAGKRIATRFYTISYAKGRKNVGTYKVTVRFKGEYSGSKTLTFTIKPSVKASVSLLTGATSKIGAKSNGKITYSSSNKKVATVSSAGVITAVKRGTATITVKSGSVSHKITVTITNPYVKVSGTNSMLLKKSVTLKTTSNTTAKVTWSSSNKKVATVSSTGRVTGQGAGSATIYAKITYKGKTYTGRYTVTVKKPYLTKTSATIDKGKTYQLSVNGGSGAVTYTSSNNKVATVSSKGVVKGVGKGSATITVKRNGYTMKFTVKVTVNADREILAAYAEFILKNCALKNPSTYKVNNYIYKKSGSSYTVYVWYSAANGFGGMIDGWAMAKFDTEKSVIAYSVTYGKKYINVYTGCSRPSTFDGYVDADAVEEQYDKIGIINYYRPII